MKKEEAKTCLVLLRSGFTSPLFLTDENQVATWEGFLAKYDYVDVKSAIQDYILNCSKVPTIADIHERIKMNERDRLELTKNSYSAAQGTYICPVCHNNGYIYISSDQNQGSALCCNNPRCKARNGWEHLGFYEGKA